MTETGLILSSERLGELCNDAMLFRSENTRYSRCEEADAEQNPEKRLNLRKRLIQDGFIWGHQDFSSAEVDMLYGMAREAARIALARRSADFCRKYGIALTCGTEPPPASDPGASRDA